MTMFRLILQDLHRKAEWYELAPAPRSLLRMGVSDGSTAQLLYRAMEFCQSHRLGLVAMALYRWNAAIAHAVIGRGARLGPGLVIVHSLGIVINSEVRAGKNLTIEHGVTIGASHRGGRSPVLGDNVFIGAGAKVIGDIRIGSDVTIGANAVVTRSLPDGATAVGIPARVVKVYGRRVEREETAEIPRASALQPAA